VTPPRRRDAAAAALKPPVDGATGAGPDAPFDALLVVAFGGPEGMDDVMPFLENVTRGRGVPRERLEAVAEHYALFGGISPINDQSRALVEALRQELDAAALRLPVYLGNRNWHPFLVDAVREMAADGVERALAFFTSGFSSYSSCRQYRENIYEAQEAVGSEAPEILRLRAFYNHPGFVEASVDLLSGSLERLSPARREDVHVAFTAHSIPVAMARGCRYEAQLREAARLVAKQAGTAEHAVVYQSRSGSPVPWLEPDVCDHLRTLAARGVESVVLSPLGFVSDHLEVLYDLDIEARAVAEELGLGLVRTPTVGTHPAFVGAIRELVEERVRDVPRRALGRFGAAHDVCAVGCCLPGTGRPSPWEQPTSGSAGPRAR
jgi:protoporphyrin/coproporphyrin ferrochelatase